MNRCTFAALRLATQRITLGKSVLSWKPIMSFRPRPLAGTPLYDKDLQISLFSSSARIDIDDDDALVDVTHENNGIQLHQHTVGDKTGKPSSSSSCSSSSTEGVLDSQQLVNQNDDAAAAEDEMEQEDMFVEPHESFFFRTMEWGGPRRGGRLPEPTRYGDWERKGRCTDF